MHRGLPCRSAGLATSRSGSTAASARGSPACGSWIGSVINSKTASLAKSTRKERCHALLKMVQRKDTSDHDARITPKGIFYGSAKRKTAARSEIHARTQLAGMNKVVTFY